MKFESKEVTLIMPDKSTVRGEFRMFDSIPEKNGKVRLSLLFSGRDITSDDDEYFSAMISIRCILEKEGILLNCYGASENVYPSGMSRQMGYGTMAFKERMGEPALMKDLVSIFDSGPDVIPATVKQQKDFLNAWFVSLGFESLSPSAQDEC